MKTKAFKSGNSQAVRIPADIAFADMNAELEITRNGDVVVIRPANAAHTLREAFALLDKMPKPETTELIDRTRSRDTLDDLS